MSDKITIITICYQAERTLARTIESVLAQQYKNIEYIIIDGGSRDGTVGIIRQYESRITYWHSKKDNGLYDALNQGIALATGDIIGFLHADDIFAHDQVLSEVGKALQDNTIDAVYADLNYVNAQGQVIRSWQSSDFKKGSFARGFSPAHPTFYMRKRCYEAHGGFDLSYPIGNDIELMMRYMERVDIKTLYVPSLWVIMELGGISNRSMKNIIAQNKAILTMAKAHHLKANLLSFMLWKGCSRLVQFWRGRRCQQSAY